LFQKELGTIPEQEGEQENDRHTDETIVSEDNNATATLDKTLSDETLSDETLSDKTLSDKTLSDKTLSDEKVFKEVIMNPTTADYVKIDTMKLNASMDFYLNK
jgi:hypothetical protein